MQLEAVVCNAPVMFQAWHSFEDFHVNPYVGVQGANIILADDFVGDNVQDNLHVFVPGNWSVIIKVSYVQGQEQGIGGGNNDIQQTFGCCEAGAFCGGNSWKSSLSLPTVTQTRWFSVLCGRIMETRR